MRSATAAALFLVALATISTSAHAQWIDAGATFFGTDAWSIHTGSCGFGYICPNRWTPDLKQGWDVVAITDSNPMYNGMQGSQCGKCLAIKCRSASVTDGDGNVYDREGLCKNTNWVVKVKIVDTCLCHDPANPVSNARWCCGGKAGPHLDVSKWALDKIVDDSERWGVFAISYMQIDCGDDIQPQAPWIPRAADPHAAYGDGVNCAAQGGQSSSSQSSSSSSSSGNGSASSSSASGNAQSSSSASYSSGLSTEGVSETRAIAHKSYGVGRHSMKWHHRRQHLIAERGKKHYRGFYKRVYAWYAQFNSKMQKVRKYHVKYPFYNQGR